MRSMAFSAIHQAGIDIQVSCFKSDLFVIMTFAAQWADGRGHQSQLGGKMRFVAYIAALKIGRCMHINPGRGKLPGLRAGGA